MSKARTILIGLGAVVLVACNLVAAYINGRAIAAIEKRLGDIETVSRQQAQLDRLKDAVKLAERLERIESMLRSTINRMESADAIQ